jgi:SAM-dependent methyltransferase
MPTVRLSLPVYLPGWLQAPLRRAKHALFPQRTEPVAIDLSGDREVEWSFLASRIPPGPGTALDFGCGSGNLSIHAIQRGYRVLALDLEEQRFPWWHPNLESTCGDLLELELPIGGFDLILNCSSVEHVGLTGRYGVAVKEMDGDIAAMQKMRQLLKPSGKMLLTVPCGQDAVIAPWHRVYGPERLPKLLQGYSIEDQVYWAKRQDNRWYPSDRERALAYLPTSHPTSAYRCSYALGCFVLRATGR